MNRLSAAGQAMVRERPGDFPVNTRNDVPDQQVREPRHFRPDHNSNRREDRILAGLRDTAMAAREEHEEAQEAQEHPPEKVGVPEASQRLSCLVRRAKGGETITVNGKVSAQLCPVVPRIDAKGDA